MAGLRRSWWQSGAAVLVALVAAGALFGVAVLVTGMDRVVQGSLEQLGAHLVLAPSGQRTVAEQLLRTGEAGPLEPSISVNAWRQRLKEGKVIGIVETSGWSLAAGGKGEPASGDQASLLLIRLENWASPIMAVQEIAAAIPEAEIIEAEQAIRHLSRYTAPMVRYVSIAAVVALLAALLMTGLLTTIRVAERRSELGMIRAVGASRAFLIGLTLAESGVLAVGGAVAGVLLALLAGLGLTGSAARFAASLSAGEILLRAVAAALGTAAMGLLAALGPAVRAAAMDPLEAIRRGR